MGSRESVVMVSAWLVTALAAVPLAAQPSSRPFNIHPIPRLQSAPSSFAPPEAGQNETTAPNVPSLVFDAETKEYDAAPGEKFAPFTFNLTNVWTNEIIIDKVHASCGCTTATLPANPWHIPPQGGGPIQVQVNLAGKMGLIVKTVTFYYKMGGGNATVMTRVINLKVKIPPPPASSGMLTEEERKAAAVKAMADAQSIFRGDCARCHVDKGRDAVGQELYAADCGICHESSHREKFVPDLHALKQVTDMEYWKTVITAGKPHTMMPPFAASRGGPLTDAQIQSLAAYLDHTISHHFSATPPGAAKL